MIRVNQALDGPETSQQIVYAAVAIKTLLRRAGPSEIFATEMRTTSQGIRPVGDYVTSGRNAKDDVLLVHVAGHHPHLIQWLMRRPERVVAMCHTVGAPATMVAPSACPSISFSAGSDLRLLRHRADAALALCPSDASTLKRLGFSNVVLTTLPLDPTDLVRTPPDENAVADFDGPLLLAAGPITPARRVDHLVLAYHALVTYDRPDASLVVAGPPGPTGYVEAVRQMITDLELTRARLLVGASDGQLAAYYRRSSSFVSASEHEGFGLDLLRALAFGAPVVARRGWGLEDVLNGAGILVDMTEPPTVLAAALAAVLDRADLRDDLAARSRLAFEKVSVMNRACEFLRSVLNVL